MTRIAGQDAARGDRRHRRRGRAGRARLGRGPRHRAALFRRTGARRTRRRPSWVSSPARTLPRDPRSPSARRSRVADGSAAAGPVVASGRRDPGWAAADPANAMTPRPGTAARHRGPGGCAQDRHGWPSAVRSGRSRRRRLGARGVTVDVLFAGSGQAHARVGSRIRLACSGEPRRVSPTQRRSPRPRTRDHSPPGSIARRPPRRGRPWSRGLWWCARRSHLPRVPDHHGGFCLLAMTVDPRPPLVHPGRGG